MKKLFIVLAVASLGFVACNNESKNETSADTSATVSPAPDTMTTAPMQDTTAMKDTTAKKDTTQK
jgi:hypothetical protein